MPNTSTAPYLNMKKTKYQVRHILVQHQYEALDLLRKLNDDAKFQDLAKKYSICPSSENGGDLGPLKIGQADSDFEEASLHLKTNEITKKPIRTRFGYHLIQRIDSGEI